MSNSIIFHKAIKYEAKLRLALIGPAGSGKTYTALTLGSHLGNPIAYVDTEHGSAKKYADIFNFDVIEPGAFDPRELIEIILYSVRSHYSVLGIDNLSHYWAGTGGELDMVDAAAKKIQGNSFAAWKHVTPIHNKLVDTIISAPIHIIACLRTKTEWVIEKDEKGKSVPRKIGLAPVMRDGIEYEFDVCGDLDQENTLVITKSRCPELSGKVINRPGREMAEILTRWLSGAPRPQESDVVMIQPPMKASAQAGPASGNTSEDGSGNASIPGRIISADRVKREANGETPQGVQQLWALMKNVGSICEIFAGFKRTIQEISGADHEYYAILGRHGMEHANNCRQVGMGRTRKCAKELLEYVQKCKAAIQSPMANLEPITDDDIPAELGGTWTQTPLIPTQEEPDGQ